MSKPWHKFTEEEDAYIIEKWQNRTAYEIGYHLKIPKEIIRYRADRLRREAAKKHDFTTYTKLQTVPQFNEREIIYDGYDTVPWWMRQSTRCQTLHTEVYAGINSYDKYIKPKRRSYHERLDFS